MVPTGHDAFGKAAPKQPNTEGVAAMGVGGLYTAHSVAAAPLLKTGRKKPTQMVQASPKDQAGRYQGELVHAMKQGDVPKDSTLRVLKTPSGRYINAGGTHRHIAREAMGEPTKKISVAHLAFEPHNNLYDRIKQRRGIRELKQGSKAAVKGKNKPVQSWAREANVHAAAAADHNDEVAWKAFKSGGGRDMVTAARNVHRANLRGAAVSAGIGATIAGAGALEHHAEKKRLEKVGKAMNGHDGFWISKAAGTTDVAATTKGKKVSVAYPPEVRAYIDAKKGELSKSVSGHEAFLLEGVEKAFPGLGEAANAGKMAMGAARSILKPGGGAHVGPSKIGALKPMLKTKLGAQMSAHPLRTKLALGGAAGTVAGGVVGGGAAAMSGRRK